MNKIQTPHSNTIGQKYGPFLLELHQDVVRIMIKTRHHLLMKGRIQAMHVNDVVCRSIYTLHGLKKV